MSHWLLAILLTFTGLNASAVEVMFVEADRDGKLIQLEPGGRFYHVAIRYGDKWFHAHSHKGVDLIDNLEIYGHRFFILRNDEWPGADPRFVNEWLGKGFDRAYTWNSDTLTYCTRLVAEALGIPPEPMSFAADHWDKNLPWPQGQMGLSPDKLYRQLLLRGFTEQKPAARS